jgi:hypothetical protein
VAGAVFNDKVSGDNLSVASTGTFSNKNAATGKTVALANTLGGDDLDNYSITEQTNTSADIGKADLMVSGLSANNKVYDATAVAALIGTPVVTALGLDVVTLGGTATGAFADKNVGTAKAVTVTGVTLDSTSANNYNLIQQAGLTADISKANLTVSGLSASNKVYDATAVAALTGTAVVTPLGSDVIILGGTATGAFADKNVGTGKAVAVTGVTLDSTSANNYNLIQQAGLTADIDAASTPVQETAKAVAQATAARAAIGSVSTPQANLSLSTTTPSSLGNMAPSGGLSFVEVPSESVTSSENTGNTKTANRSTQGGSSNVSAGRDVSGFMRIFVVGGGINLEGR